MVVDLDRPFGHLADEDDLDGLFRPRPPRDYCSTFLPYEVQAVCGIIAWLIEVRAYVERTCWFCGEQVKAQHAPGGCPGGY